MLEAFLQPEMFKEVGMQAGRHSATRACMRCVRKTCQLTRGCNGRYRTHGTLTGGFCVAVRAIDNG